jgi:hypothetical protein
LRRSVLSESLQTCAEDYKGLEVLICDDELGGLHAFAAVTGCLGLMHGVRHTTCEASSFDWKAQEHASGEQTCSVAHARLACEGGKYEGIGEVPVPAPVQRSVCPALAPGHMAFTYMRKMSRD